VRPFVLAKFCQLLSLKNRKTSQRQELAFCAVFRDEAPYLDEWIQFHLGQGVSHFFLYDHESRDNFRDVLAPWQSKGVITLLKVKGKTQEETYTHCLKRARKKFKWLGCLDIDEFIFSPGGRTLPEVIARYSNFSAVFVFWRVFGTSNRQSKGERGVIESFTKCLQNPETTSDALSQLQEWQSLRASSGLFLTGNPIQGKSLVNLSKVKKMSIHFPDIYEGTVVDEVMRPINAIEEISEIYTSQYVPTMNDLRINHYWARGYESLERKTKQPGLAAIYKTHPNRNQSLSIALEWEAKLNDAKDYAIFPCWRPISAPRVFLIGFNKTATRAFAEFFEENGMPSIHWDNNKLVQQMVTNLAQRRKILDGYDSMYKFYSDFILQTDSERIEGNSFFREMDDHYPGSYFILNNRKTADWILSRERHNAGNFLLKNFLIMGTKDLDYVKRQWEMEKEKHESEVRQYFFGRTDFIEIDINTRNIPELVSNFLSMDFDPIHWKVIGKTPSR
jgi:hypothetical protein